MDQLESRDVDLLATSRDECAYQLCHWSELALDTSSEKLESVLGQAEGQRSRPRLVECSVQHVVSEIVKSLGDRDAPTDYKAAFLGNADEILKSDAHDVFVSHFGADLAWLYCVGGIHENSASRLDSARYVSHRFRASASTVT